MIVAAEVDIDFGSEVFDKVHHIGFFLTEDSHFIVHLMQHDLYILYVLLFLRPQRRNLFFVLSLENLKFIFKLTQLKTQPVSEIHPSAILRDRSLSLTCASFSVTAKQYSS